jgi:hypothetical protein
MTHDSFHIEVVVVIELALPPVLRGDRGVRIARKLEGIGDQV